MGKSRLMVSQIKQLLLIMFVVSYQVQGQSQNKYLVKPGGQWRYYDKTEPPAKDWNTGRSSQSWPVGFAQFGYGEGDERTKTRYGIDANNKVVTQYFVGDFHIVDINQIDKLQLQLLVDDGAVVYINGKEVKRYHLPQKSEHQTLATSAFIESLWLSEDISTQYLVNGENTIAVEVHQISTTSSDLSFDLALHQVSAQLPNDINNMTITELQSGQSVLVSQSQVKRFSRVFQIELKRATSALKVTLSGGSGDGDLYIAKDVIPTFQRNLVQEHHAGDELISLKNVSAGRYYIRVFAYRPFADVALKVKW